MGDRVTLAKRKRRHHGGFVSAAAYIMMAYAITTLLHKDQTFVSINLHTTFHRPDRCRRSGSRSKGGKIQAHCCLSDRCLNAKRQRSGKRRFFGHDHAKTIKKAGWPPAFCLSMGALFLPKRLRHHNGHYFSARTKFSIGEYFRLYFPLFRMNFFDRTDCL
jgi:hypothetical protein